MGRRAHRPDAFHRRQVEAMAGYGVPENDIARVLAIDPKTLRKHYREELDTGQIKATAKVAEFLFRKATTEGPQCVTAAIFWMKRGSTYPPSSSRWKRARGAMPSTDGPSWPQRWPQGGNGNARSSWPSSTGFPATWPSYRA